METIAQGCRAVLMAAAPAAKIKIARAVARAWRKGLLAHTFDTAMPESPARPAAPELLPPNKMPRRSGGSERGRLALVHALAHIEYVAIDLAFDAAGRFGNEFPRGFVDDWMNVGADEAMHFALLDRRLKALGSRYGALPAHAGLWEAAHATRGNALARLAVVPMVLEARGLDVTPATRDRFRAAGDDATARILHRILSDEIRHVGAGVRWFRHGCDMAGSAPAEHWRAMVHQHYRGLLKPPFNDSARAAAGLTLDYYASLAADAEPWSGNHDTGAR
jgi:uncharacterized ferritin-like protein (DUF455 family)